MTESFGRAGDKPKCREAAVLAKGFKQSSFQFLAWRHGRQLLIVRKEVGTTREGLLGLTV